MQLGGGWREAPDPPPIPSHQQAHPTSPEAPGQASRHSSDPQVPGSNPGGGTPGRHLVREVAQHPLKAVSTPTAHAVADEPVWVCTIHAPVMAPPASGTNLRTGPTAGSAHRTRPSDLDTRRVGL